MVLERFINQLSQKTGRSGEGLRVEIAVRIQEGANKHQLYNEFVRGSGEDNHASSPKHVRKRRNTPDSLTSD